LEVAAYLAAVQLSALLYWFLNYCLNDDRGCPARGGLVVLGVGEIKPTLAGADALAGQPAGLASTI
jgi:hypothetical protein